MKIHKMSMLPDGNDESGEDLGSGTGGTGGSGAGSSGGSGSQGGEGGSSGG